MDIKVSEFNAALEQLEVSRGISKETALAALQEAMLKGFKKDIGDDEAQVVVNIDLEKGKIDMYQIKTVVEDAEDILLQRTGTFNVSLNMQKKLKMENLLVKLFLQ